MHRLLLVTHYYPAHGGGIESVALALGTRLAQSTHWQIAWMAGACDPAPSGLPEKLKCVPVSVWNGVERKFGAPMPIWSISGLMMLWREVGRANAVHLHDALYFGNAFAWLFARLRGIPVVVTQHVGLVPYRSRLMRTLHAVANRTLGRLVLTDADQVLFISAAVRDEFAAFCHFRRPPLYWPNGVDTAIFSPDGPMADDDEIRAARDGGRRICLFVGRFVEKKGLAILHELVPAFPDDLWVFAGNGPLNPASWSLPNVRVIRGVSGADLARYYRSADLLVLPSQGEGFPLVVQEAMACGTPVLVSSQTAAGAPNSMDYLFAATVGDRDTVARWSKLLADSTTMPDRLRLRRASVAQFAKSQWSWNLTVSAYDALFARLIAQMRR